MRDAAEALRAVEPLHFTECHVLSNLYFLRERAAVICLAVNIHVPDREGKEVLERRADVEEGQENRRGRLETLVRARRAEAICSP